MPETTSGQYFEANNLEDFIDAVKDGKETVFKTEQFTMKLLKDDEVDIDPSSQIAIEAELGDKFGLKDTNDFLIAIGTFTKQAIKVTDNQAISAFVISGDWSHLKYNGSINMSVATNNIKNIIAIEAYGVRGFAASANNILFKPILSRTVGLEIDTSSQTREEALAKLNEKALADRS